MKWKLLKIPIVIFLKISTSIHSLSRNLPYTPTSRHVSAILLSYLAATIMQMQHLDPTVLCDFYPSCQVKFTTTRFPFLKASTTADLSSFKAFIWNNVTIQQTQLKNRSNQIKEGPIGWFISNSTCLFWW